MSNLFTPQSDQPWKNHEFVYYEITEVEQGRYPSRIGSLIGFAHWSGVNIKDERRFDRNFVIERLKNHERWMLNDQQLNLVVINGHPFIRTDQQQIEADYVQ